MPRTRLRPAQVLEMRLDLARRAQDPAFADYVTVAAFGELATSNKATSQGLGQHLERIASASETFLVTDEMTHVVAAAAAALNDEDVVDRTLAPSPYGLVRFNTPLPITDARGSTLLMHWLAWTPFSGSSTSPLGVTRAVPGVMFLTFNDREDPDDAEAAVRDRLSAAGYAVLNRIAGRWALLGLDAVKDGYRIGAGTIPMTREQHEQIVRDGDTPHELTNVTRYAHALWLLLGQTITEVDQWQRRKRRPGPRRMPTPGTISVVKMRRITRATTGQGTDTEWQHRWYVRGHWAWRACGQGHPMAQEYDKGWRIRLWISPYIKGPEGSPFKQTEKVNVLAR